jgi:putative Mn2+ efflux pump MntP
VGILELLFIAIGLAMDAFAVSIVKGLEMKNVHYGDCFRLAVAFGVFQAAMPLLGYFLGDQFAVYVERFSHWISFFLLAFIGGKMIRDAIKERRLKDEIREEEEEEAEGRLSADQIEELEEEEKEYEKIQHKDLIMLAVATSIDAFAVGVTFALTPSVNIWTSIAVIGVVTFIASFIAVHIGSTIGSKLETQAEIVGGIILIGIAVKILLDGLGVI